MTSMRVFHVLIVYVLLGTAAPLLACAWLLDGPAVVSPTRVALAFFLVLNVLICLWEIALGRYISEIAAEFAALQKTFGARRWDAVMHTMLFPIESVSQLFSMRFWTRIWSTYALFDSSYANRESFGFFVDVGNGWTTLLPSALFIAALVAEDAVCSARVLGCIGLCKFWQELYGTVIYFLSFFMNGRQRGKSWAEVILFIGGTNGLWFFFPLLGMRVCVQMIESNTYVALH